MPVITITSIIISIRKFLISSAKIRRRMILTMGCSLIMTLVMNLKMIMKMTSMMTSNSKRVLRSMRRTQKRKTTSLKTLAPRTTTKSSLTPLFRRRLTPRSKPNLKPKRRRLRLLAH